MRHANVLTAHGFARVLARGIQANFAPTHQAAEIDRLVEYLQDLAMSRAMESELPACLPTAATQARRDADWLETIAGQLEAAKTTSTTNS
jgi:hypothetical protein